MTMGSRPFDCVTWNVWAQASRELGLDCYMWMSKVRTCLPKLFLPDETLKKVLDSAETNPVFLTIFSRSFCS